MFLLALISHKAEPRTTTMAAVEGKIRDRYQQI